jgi:membrane protease YdiL (CAAX protease family)/predicted permease
LESELIDLYHKAKYVNREVFVEAQLKSAGSNQARLLERMEKSKNFMRNNVIATKVVYAFVLCFMPILLLIGYFEVIQSLGSAPIEAIIFTESIIFSIFFGLNFSYLILFGMLNTSSFMSGESFDWLHTLPISEKKVKKLGFMTLFRSLDLPLIAMIVAFPVVIFIGTQDILLTVITAITSVPNVLLSFCILIFIGEKLSRILYGKQKATKKASILRMATMVGYILMAMSLGFIIQLAFQAVGILFDLLITYEYTSILGVVFSLIPYPFAPSFFISNFLAPTQIPPLLWVTSSIGFILFLILTWLVYQKAVNSLELVTASEKMREKVEETSVKEKEIVEVEITTKRPIIAYMRKDLTTATRDFQTFMFMIFPIILPLIMVFSASAGIEFANPETLDILIIWLFVLMTCTYIPAMLVSGLLNMEETGSAILSSLPILPRDQAKAKLLLMLSIQTFSFLITPLIFSLIFGVWIVFVLIVSSIPLAWTFMILFFELKIRFFGQMKYKYVIEEINRNYKILKWVIMLAIELGLFVLLLITVFNIAFITLNIPLVSIILLGVGTTGTLILWYAFNRMFPKPEEMKRYKTGGALRHTPAVGAIVLAITYIGFQFIPGFLELLLIPILPYLSLIGLYFIDFLFVFGTLAFLWLYVVPFGFKLPNKDRNFGEYLQDIGLGKNQPIFKNIAIGLASFGIFAIVVWLGGILLGTYIFDPNILFGTPTITNLGWFLFVIMLIPGIWEEFSFRGVIIPNLKRKYSQTQIILISGLVFGFTHAINFLNILVGGNPVFVLYQIIYASLLGFGFGYMFLRTESLIPCIILHYLVDSVGQLFLNTLFTDWISISVYLIGFLGIIPAILIILFVKLVTKENGR